MRDLRALARDRYLVLTGTVFGALCAVVLGVGAVATAAELLNTWNHYFVMERTVAVATPVATTLLVASVLLGLGAVARA